jgi:hypothetical protein
MKISDSSANPLRPTPAAEKTKPASAGAEFRVSSEKASAAALSGISARYSSADLQKADRADAAIRESLQVILGEDAVASRLPEEHREKLLDFLQADPLVRAKVTSYLQSILS